MSTFFRYIIGNKKKEKTIIIKMLDNIELEPYQKEYFVEHFLDVLYDDFDMIAIKNKIAFHFFRFTALISGVLIPIIANIDCSNKFTDCNRTIFITVLGIITSISFGFLNIYQNERVWLHHRKTFEILRTEGYKFLNLAGKYKHKDGHKEVYPFFVENIENIIKLDINEYTTIIGNRKKNNKGSN